MGPPLRTLSMWVCFSNSKINKLSRRTSVPWLILIQILPSSKKGRKEIVNPSHFWRENTRQLKWKRPAVVQQGYCGRPPPRLPCLIPVKWWPSSRQYLQLTWTSGWNQEEEGSKKEKEIAKEKRENPRRKGYMRKKREEDPKLPTKLMHISLLFYHFSKIRKQFQI